MMRSTGVAAALTLGFWPAASSGQTPIQWEPYELAGPGEVLDTVRLGRLKVPARHDAPGADSMEVAFAFLPARASGSEAPLVYLDGGPGGNGVGVARIPSYWRLFDEARESRDVILLSQRGTGLSRPALFCRLVEPLSPNLFRHKEDMLAGLESSVDACVAQWQGRGVDLGAVNTWESAGDIEAIRRALGRESVALLGFSYGTHLGLAYARRYPSSLERLVLLGAEGPDHTWKLPETLDRQIRHLSALYGRQEGLPLDRLEQDVRRLLERLDRDPVAITVRSRSGDSARVMLGGDGFRYLLRRDLGDTNDLPRFPALVHNTLDGDLGLVSGLASRRFYEIAGVPLMSLLTDCAAGVSTARAEKIAHQREGSILRGMADGYFPEVCQSLPVEGRPADYHSSVFISGPVLFVSGTLDANTPPFQAEEIRWGLPAADHLVVRNAGHESTLRAPCVLEAIGRFLRGEESEFCEPSLEPLIFR